MPVSKENLFFSRFFSGILLYVIPWLPVFLISTPAYERLADYLFQGETGIRFLKELERTPYYDGILLDDNYISASDEEAEALFRAMGQDAQEGNFPLTTVPNSYPVSLVGDAPHGSYVTGWRLYISEEATHTVAFVREYLS